MRALPVCPLIFYTMISKYRKTEGTQENWVRILDYNSGCAPKDNYHYILNQLSSVGLGPCSLKVKTEHNLGCGCDAPDQALYIEVNSLKKHLDEPIIIKYYYGDSAFPNTRNVDWIIVGDASKTAPYYLTFIIRPDNLP